MKKLDRRIYLAVPLLAIIGVASFWAISTSEALTIRIPGLPTGGTTFGCDVDVVQSKDVVLAGVGTFSTAGLTDAPKTVAEAGEAYISNEGLKTVPLRLLANGGHNFAEGLGDTHYWLDNSRPIPGAVWEKKAGTELPAIHETRFHFLYTVEALPGKVFRSKNPAVMRADNVTAWPPPPGTVYRLVRPVDLEELGGNGEVVGRILTNQSVVSG